MAQVTYRGVQYDTETRLQEQKIQQPQQKQLVTGVLRLKEESNASNCRNPRSKRSFSDDHLRRG